MPGLSGYVSGMHHCFYVRSMMSANASTTSPINMPANIQTMSLFSGSSLNESIESLRARSVRQEPARQYKTDEIVSRVISTLEKLYCKDVTKSVLVQYAAARDRLIVCLTDEDCGGQWQDDSIGNPGAARIFVWTARGTRVLDSGFQV